MFAPGSDAVPRLLSTLQPAVAATLYSALNTTPLGSPAVTGASLMRVKAAPFGAQAPPKPDVAKPTGKRHGLRVLVVDDHHDTCVGMKMMLERRGYDITIANSADQAVQKADADNFDMVISDIGLPDRSGYELMRELRATKGVPGIALSGFGSEDDIAKAREAGFAEHLTKPINFDRLEEAMQSILQAQPAADGKGTGAD